MAQHSQLEALAMALLSRMTRGLIQSAVPLNRDDWSERYE